MKSKACRIPLSVFAITLTASTLFGQVLQKTSGGKSPAQILSENGSLVALIVSADEESIGLGSGFFVGDGSLLVTNFHVIEGAKRLLVKIGDGRILEANRVASFDIDRDLAILKLETGGNRGLALGDSDAVKVGESVVVISNPRGLEHSISNGLISGVRDFETLPRALQISAPISPGSSGGPVFNDRGEVIGVIQFYLEGGQNLNFAIPINFVKEMMLRRSNTFLADLPARKRAPETEEERQASPLNLDGSWTATFADSVSSGQIVFNLAQETSGTVRGTYTTSLGGGGIVTGHVTDDLFQFELAQTIQTCPGKFVGSAKLKQGTVSGSYTGTSCDGFHANGSFSMVRGPGTLLPPATAVAVRGTGATPSSGVLGNIFITSSPVGAEIYADSLFVGKTPYTMKLKPGQHTILLLMKDYKNWSKIITAEAGSEVRQTATLEKSNYASSDNAPKSPSSRPTPFRPNTNTARTATVKLLVFGGADHKTYLGCLNCSRYAGDSIFNEYGNHGSRYSSESIWNHYNEYGSAYSTHGACNPYAGDPPVIVDQDGKYYGRLTLNTYHAEFGAGASYYDWLKQTVCEED